MIAIAGQKIFRVLCGTHVLMQLKQRLPILSGISSCMLLFPYWTQGNLSFFNLRLTLVIYQLQVISNCNLEGLGKQDAWPELVFFQ